MLIFRFLYRIYVSFVNNLTNNGTFLLKNIDNDIFSDIIFTNAISSDLKIAAPDHLLQFLIAPDIFGVSPSNKFNHFE